MLLRTLDTTRATSSLTPSLDLVGSSGVLHANRRITAASATVTLMNRTERVITPVSRSLLSTRLCFPCPLALRRPQLGVGPFSHNHILFRQPPGALVAVGPAIAGFSHEPGVEDATVFLPIDVHLEWTKVLAP
jgi:hypothetical protein